MGILLMMFSNKLPSCISLIFVMLIGPVIKLLMLWLKESKAGLIFQVWLEDIPGDLGPVWFKDSSVFKTHNSNPKLITPYSNLTSLKNYKTHVWTHNSITYLYNFLPNPWTPPTDTTQCCLLLLLVSLHLYLSNHQQNPFINHR